MADHWHKQIERILRMNPAGAGSEPLKSALRTFWQAWNKQPQSDAELDTAVVAIAGALNRDVEEMRLAFETFRRQATEETQNEAPASFFGSREALLFGQVVGDVLGLDAVFAALLSPTGGMVGPGGASVHVKGGVLGYHGVAHDAGGYLCRRHEIDPGYEYIIERSGLPCEDSPLAGQVSGIAFWFKVLKLGWLNFLAESDPLEHTTPALESLAPAPRPSSSDSNDGVVLNDAEILFLKSLITREADAADADRIAEGFRSLQERGFVSGSETEGYTISDQLVMATAVYLEPKQVVEVSPGAFEDMAGGEPISFYQWEDLVIEQTRAGPGQIRLAGLQDAQQAVDRLGQVIPLSESELEALSLSLTEDEFDTAVAGAQGGAIDLGDALPLESLGGPLPEAAADLSESLGSGQLVGSIRVRKFDGRDPAGTRELQFLEGPQATWLVSRDSENAGRVEVSLASREALQVVE